MNKYFSKDKNIKHFFRLGILIILFALFSSESPAQEKGLPLTNENFLRKTINKVLEDCFKDAPFGSKSVWIEQGEKNPSAWIVEEEIVSYLQKRGPVGIEGKEEEGDLSLNFRIIKLSLEYPEVKRKKLLGKSWVRREAQVLLSFKLSDYQGKVLWSKRGEERESDLVKMSQLEDLNNRHYPFLSPEVPESSWGKYAEPVVVTVVVGALVYLFFANR